MTPLSETLTEYLAVRRAVGYKLERHGMLLPQFVRYLERVGADTITIEHALDWATLPTGVQASCWANRLTVVRGFARYVQSIDPTVQVPPTWLLNTRLPRATPYLYSEQEVTVLIAATGTLRFPLGVATYRTLIGLLAVSGLRLGEAIGLDREDIDFEHGVLVVHNSKFKKSREIPLHPSTIGALAAYLRQRDALHPRPSTLAAFISTTGARLNHTRVQATFAKLVRRAGLEPRSARCRPRLHEYADVFVMPMLLRGGCSVRFWGLGCRHNQSASRNARSVSGGW